MHNLTCLSEIPLAASMLAPEPRTFAEDVACTMHGQLLEAGFSVVSGVTDGSDGGDFGLPAHWRGSLCNARALVLDYEHELQLGSYLTLSYGVHEVDDCGGEAAVHVTPSLRLLKGHGKRQRAHVDGAAVAHQPRVVYPVVIYMYKEVCGENDRAKTLLDLKRNALAAHMSNDVVVPFANKIALNALDAIGERTHSALEILMENSARIGMKPKNLLALGRSDSQLYRYMLSGCESSWRKFTIDEFNVPLSRAQASALGGGYHRAYCHYAFERCARKLGASEAKMAVDESVKVSRSDDTTLISRLRERPFPPPFHPSFPGGALDPFANRSGRDRGVPGIIGGPDDLDPLAVQPQRVRLPNPFPHMPDDPFGQGPPDAGPGRGPRYDPVRPRLQPEFGPSRPFGTGRNSDFFGGGGFI